MTKPKDRTGEFKRQHKRILEEHAALLTRLELYEHEKSRAVEATSAVFQAEIDRMHREVDEAVAGMARIRASNKLLEEELDIVSGQIVGVKDALATERSDRFRDQLLAGNLAKAKDAQIAEFQRLLDEHAPAMARLEELVKRWEGRAKKAEYAEANALLNREALVKAVPGMRRG